MPLIPLYHTIYCVLFAIYILYIFLCVCYRTMSVSVRQDVYYFLENAVNARYNVMSEAKKSGCAADIFLHGINEKTACVREKTFF